MRHLILGAGNLGTDLYVELSKRKRNDVTLNSHYRFTHDSSLHFMMEYDVVWCAVGAGGPTDDPLAFARQVNAHLLLPWALANNIADTKIKLVLFSTHYLNQDPKGDLSKYARTKALMEEYCKKQNVVIARVGSLYGAHYPMRTLPGKIVDRLERNLPIIGVQNRITPTSTASLAKDLVLEEIWEHDQGISRCGPTGDCTVYEWIQKIARSYSAASGRLPSVGLQLSGFDGNYPKDCSAKSQYGSSWALDWNGYGERVIDASIAEVLKAQRESESGSSHRSLPHPQ